jgi:alpha-galactosidase
MRVEFDRAAGRLSFYSEDGSSTQIENCTAWARYRLADGTLHNHPLAGLGASIQEQEISDVHGNGSEWVLSCPNSRDDIQLTYHIKSYHERPFILLRISIHNHRRDPITLHNLCLLQASPSNAGRILLQAPVDGYRFLKIGWHGWDDSSLRSAHERNSRSWLDRLTRAFYSNPATQKPKGTGEFCSEGWGIFVGRQGAIVAGFASTARQFGQVYASLRSGHEAIMLLTQLDEVRLDAGEKCDSEWGFLQFVTLPDPAPQLEFVTAAGREMKARVPTSAPPLMWSHWYQYYDDIREESLLGNLDVLAENREALPIRLVEVDDGYQSAWGDWSSCNAKFPHGLEWLAEEISSKGFIPGLWLAPFTVAAGSQVAREHPGWLVRDKKDRPARVGFLYNRFIQALDLTHPAVLEHLQQLAHHLTQDCGFRMLKVDFLNTSALPGRRSNPKLTRADALRLGLEAIRQGAGDDIFLLGCGCPFGPAMGIVDSMRIGPDTAPSWEPDFHWLVWARPLIRGNPSMPALRNALRNTLVLNSLHRHWWWNDPDCLLVRDESTRLTEAEVQSAVSLVGLSGGMLVSSDDLRKVSPERIKWLSRLMPNLGMQGQPVNLLEVAMPSLYRVVLEHGGKRWQLVALFNWSDIPMDCHLRFADLGYLEGTSLHVFDFWQGRYQVVTDREMVFSKVAAHGCKLLRICQVEERPQLVGDTLHISQGMELSSLRIVDKGMNMETIDLDRRVEGEVWIALSHAPDRVYCNGELVDVIAKGEGIYAVRVKFLGKGSIELLY